jgi:hypothetical protein
MTEPTPTVLPDPLLEPRRPGEPPTVDIHEPPIHPNLGTIRSRLSRPRRARLSFRPTTIASGRRVLNRDTSIPLTYVVFDLLRLDGTDVTEPVLGAPRTSRLLAPGR